MRTYTESEVEAMKERWYSDSKNRAFGSVLNFLMQQLGKAENPSREALIIERQETILALRDLCDEIGDNDWDADLHLADIISKHVFPERELVARVDCCSDCLFAFFEDRGAYCNISKEALNDLDPYTQKIHPNDSCEIKGGKIMTWFKKILQ